jgi:hypothetical protein
LQIARGKPGPTNTVACKVSMISVLAHNIGDARCIPGIFYGPMVEQTIQIQKQQLADIL